MSATLSVLYAAWRGDDALRYLTSDSGTFADIRSRAELDAIDEQLAEVALTQSASLVRTIDEATRVGRGGTLIVITGRPNAELAPALELARRRYGQVIPLLCESMSPGLLSTLDLPSGSILYDGETPLAELWTATLAAAKLHRSVSTTVGGR